MRMVTSMLGIIRGAPLATTSLLGVARWPMPIVTTAQTRAGRRRLPAQSPIGKPAALAVQRAPNRSRRVEVEELQEGRMRRSAARGVDVSDLLVAACFFA